MGFNETTNLHLLDEFIDSTNKYNENRVSDKVEM